MVNQPLKHQRFRDVLRLWILPALTSQTSQKCYDNHYLEDHPRTRIRGFHNHGDRKSSPIHGVGLDPLQMAFFHFMALKQRGAHPITTYPCPGSPSSKCGEHRRWEVGLGTFGPTKFHRYAFCRQGKSMSFLG